MRDIACNLIAFVIAFSAYIYGLTRVLRSGKALYFRLLVNAAGCHALEALWSIVYVKCGTPGGGLITVRLIGIFGCFCFLLSPNRGQFDRIVGDRPAAARRAAWLALAAPILLAVPLFLYMRDEIAAAHPIGAIIVFLVLCPALPASYYNLKHLLLPMDEAGLLRAARPTDIISLAIYIFNFAFLFDAVQTTDLLFKLGTVLLALLMAALVFFCERGARQWAKLL